MKSHSSNMYRKTLKRVVWVLTNLWQWHRKPTNHPWKDDSMSSLYRHNTQHIGCSIKIAGHHLLHSFTATDRNEAVCTKCGGNMTWKHPAGLCLGSSPDIKRTQKEGRNVVSQDINCSRKRRFHVNSRATVK